ncbi:hypothetical protein AHAS_Ahas12G0230500 [Arachis hypogaea]
MTEAAELKMLLSEMESKVELLEREVEFLKKDKSESEEKIRNLEKKIRALEKKELRYGGLKEKAGVAKNVIRELNQKVDTVNGGVNGNGVIARDGKGVKGLNIQWPMVVVGSTVVVAAAVICVFYKKRR